MRIGRPGVVVIATALVLVLIVISARWDSVPSSVAAHTSVEVSYANGGETPLLLIGSPVTVKASFSEPVYGFGVDDISVANGSASNLVGSDGDAVYHFDVTPTTLGMVTVDIPAGVARDADGNGNTAADRMELGIPHDDGDGDDKKEVVGGNRD